MADLPGIQRDYKSGAVPTLFEDQGDGTFAPVDASRAKLFVWDTATLAWVRMQQPTSDEILYIPRFDNDGTSNLVYLGEAVPGSAASAAVWRIRKFTYSGSDITAILFAGGEDTFTKVWNDRASYATFAWLTSLVSHKSSRLVSRRS